MTEELKSNTPKTDAYDKDNWRGNSAGWRERSITIEDALDFARKQEYSAACAEKLLLEIGHAIAERLEKIRIDSDKEPHRRNAECDIKTEDMLDMITRSIHTYKLTQSDDVAEPANVKSCGGGE
jgi:hypothetical protein